MLKTPKVSVITPAYKAARYIGQAIESVQAQTLTDWEMIIVDDASPDETAAVVERYLDDPRIKLIRSERNRGECGARNLALEAAQGEWVAPLDADDWFDPQRLERLWQIAQEKGAILVADLQLQIDDNGQTYGVAFSDTLQPPTVPTRYSIRDYLREHIAIKPFFSRRHALDHNLRYPEGIVLGGDHIFQTQLQLKGAELWIVPEPNYYYRVHPTSMVSAVGRSVEKINTLFERLLQLDEVRNNPELIRCVQADWRRVLLADKYRRFAAAVKQRQWRVALEHFSLDTASMFLKRLPGAVYRRLWAREQLRNPRASG
jgi:succinoglycan biosynthesis protein ExoO